MTKAEAIQRTGELLAALTALPDNADIIMAQIGCSLGDKLLLNNKAREVVEMRDGICDIKARSDYYEVGFISHGVHVFTHLHEK